MSSARRARRRALLGLAPSSPPALAGDIVTEPEPELPGLPQPLKVFSPKSLSRSSSSSSSCSSLPEITIIVSGNDANWQDREPAIEPVQLPPKPIFSHNLAPDSFGRPVPMPKVGEVQYRPAPNQPSFNYGLNIDTWKYYAASVISRSNI